MERRSVEAIIRGLNEAQVRYLIVGGLAVVAYGYVRLTVDVNLFLDFKGDNIRQAVASFAVLGYRPLDPVPLEQFVDDKQRAQRIQEMGSTGFCLFSPEHQATEVDLMVQAPIDFETAYANACHQDLAPNFPATIIGIEDLLFLKNQAGRDKDLLDIRKLKVIQEETSKDGDGIDDEEAGWPRGWDGHERAQLLRWAKLPLSEKIAWLEEAHRIALYLNRNRPNVEGLGRSRAYKPEVRPEDLTIPGNMEDLSC